MGKFDLLLLPYLSGMATQLIKFINSLIKEREMNFKKLIEMGGIPSTHSAASVTLTTLIGIREGLFSVFFALSLFLTIFIMIEATGIRRIAGRHAVAINRIVKSQPDSDTYYGNLLVPVGHTPFEVLVGSVFGFLFAFAFGGI